MPGDSSPYNRNSSSSSINSSLTKATRNISTCTFIWVPRRNNSTCFRRSLRRLPTSRPRSTATRRTTYSRCIMSATPILSLRRSASATNTWTPSSTTYATRSASIKKTKQPTRSRHSHHDVFISQLFNTFTSI